MGRTKAEMRAMRKKYHLGEFKHKRKVYKHQSIKQSMARKRRSKSRRSYKRFGGTKGVWSSILGVGAYILYENYLEKSIPLQEPILSIAELGVGYWMSKKGGIVGDIGKAAVMINIYQLGKYFVGSALPSIGGSSQVTSMFTYA